MSWGTWLDNGDLQREMCLDEWLFVSFLNRLGGSLFGFLRMLPTLCHSVPCSSWNLRQTFHGALSTLEDQSEEWTDTTECNEVTSDFVGQIHDISVAAVHHGKCFCCIRSFSVAFSQRKSSSFSHPDLSAVDEFSVPRFKYLAVIMFEGSVEGS